MISSIKSTSNWEFEGEICDSFQDLSHCWTDFKLGASFYGCRAPISIPNAPCMLYLVNIPYMEHIGIGNSLQLNLRKKVTPNFQHFHSLMQHSMAVLRRSMAQSNNFQDDPKQGILSHWAATVGCSSLVILLAKQFMILWVANLQHIEVFQNSTF